MLLAWLIHYKEKDKRKLLSRVRYLKQTFIMNPEIVALFSICIKIGIRTNQLQQEEKEQKYMVINLRWVRTLHNH